ncbi:hypothetical protein ACFWQG_15180 [Rhodococcus sp. NPDC058532]|uniref:hypothetical protein n=1 Tax=Rhodococcus sp. NPDC058532 TaxID=3346540 RepID=UPI00365D0A5A
MVLTSARGTIALPLAFAAATVIEIAVVHVLLPHLWLRVIVAVISVWSLIALFGHLAVHRTRPHYLTDTSLVLRQSGAVVAIVDRASIASIRPRRRFNETVPTVRAGRLHLPNADGTRVDLVLKSPVTARLPALLPARRMTEQIDRISLYLDDPSVLADGEPALAVSGSGDARRGTARSVRRPPRRWRGTDSDDRP